MTNSKTQYLFILLTFILLLANVAAQLELTALSERIAHLETQLALKPQKQSPSESNLDVELEDIQNRLLTLEQSQHAFTDQKITKTQKPNTNQATLSDEDRVEKEFLTGRTQWQDKYLPTLHADSDKKATMMVKHLVKSNTLTQSQQQQVFSILRDNFVEAAYVIADTDAYPTFADFTAQIQSLNQLKTKRLTQILSDEQLSQLNQVDWHSRFKQHALH
ncbi:hypothetical protein [Pseudoalteromonas luteoviolacea]|uniref:Uncharacterized protein n=1 Tax=Pseudoalteromonas luteoviolacea S4054 TaxID=1129367 RepID=A0A0F6AGP2_9GAMM|nr:hypothetical protein [Pseudoalteromonas luteoviolacea]AOT07855.1 hypothetical protein S4054249_08385 [Pseudoalteromonas luteoviolacea]AOT12771.1 hypothetical protein S40542_08385 [Pseudoalteromonas luteoviolacea]AOT17684.1 hypothetical protein S4054_08380 [Pseudoalteromonas luteoviolacea]KKE84966.1 hypothetical protein N479_26285 [Pseudoalteromonas luteoviolacea S4054]KZN77895.1 hypothetical protein N481_26245 [Pseudoalteromonas luteoviolacea S4047-1]